MPLKCRPTLNPVFATLRAKTSPLECQGVQRPPTALQHSQLFKVSLGIHMIQKTWSKGRILWQGNIEICEHTYAFEKWCVLQAGVRNISHAENQIGSSTLAVQVPQRGLQCTFALLIFNWPQSKATWSWSSDHAGTWKIQTNSEFWIAQHSFQANFKSLLCQKRNNSFHPSNNRS